jgi:hypothetical protein
VEAAPCVTADLGLGVLAEGHVPAAVSRGDATEPVPPRHPGHAERMLQTLRGGFLKVRPRTADIVADQPAGRIQHGHLGTRSADIDADEKLFRHGLSLSRFNKDEQLDFSLTREVPRR